MASQRKRSCINCYEPAEPTIHEFEHRRSDSINERCTLNRNEEFRRKLRQRAHISYFEPDEPAFDHYIFCEECGDYVLEYCAVHGALLVIPDDKPSSERDVPDIVPRAALTIPRVFLHLAPSIIPGAGIGVFSTLTIPRGVRFGPYCAQRAQSTESAYCWQIYSGDNRRSYVLDAADAQRSNWMRYVNCARHSVEQNLVAYQYRGRLYYRTIKIIPRFTELLVFYGSEFANALRVNLHKYNCVQYYKDVIDTQYTTHQAIEHHSSNNSASGTTNTQQDIVHNNDMEPENSDELLLDFNDFEVIDEEQSTLTNNDENLYTIRDVDENHSTQSNIEENLSTERDESLTEDNIITIHFNELADLQCPDIRNDKDIDETNNSNLGTTIKCNNCNKTFAKKRYLAAHYKRYPGTCSNFDKGKDFGNNKENDEANISRTNRLECDKCDKTFAKKKYLTAHYRRHTDTLYQCTQCQYTTAFKYTYTRHCSTHDKHKTYSCDICSYKTNIKQHFFEHRLQHNTTGTCGSKSYYNNVKKCDICPFETYSRKSFLTHMSKHRGNVYKCQQCDYSAYSKTYLRRHVLRRHDSRK